LLEFFRKAYRRVGIVNQRHYKIEIGGRNSKPTFSAIRQAAVLHAHDACLRPDLNSGGTAVKKRQKNIKLDWFVDRRACGREEKGAGQTDVARQSFTLEAIASRTLPGKNGGRANAISEFSPKLHGSPSAVETIWPRYWLQEAECPMDSGDI
jgi:hypothetical protein